ncbi:hypothetical protein ACK6D9_12190 [Hoeflea sp. Naph1]|uniref:hypothetical protein n=1 Tax=Hoeflea sp. Naph1 TaxID=3388653 RepID=UPI0039901ACD
MEPEGRRAPVTLDRKMEMRPRTSEMEPALDGVVFAELRHAKRGGGGEVDLVPVGGRIEYGPIGKRFKSKSRCLVRMGDYIFSNGEAEEPATVRTDKGVRMGAVRVPLGGIVRLGEYRPIERYGAPKGAAANDNTPETVGTSQTASPAAFDFADPVEDAEYAAHLREVVGAQTASILDIAVSSSGFGDVGRRLGYIGKSAERHGQQAVLDACAALDAALAA